MKFVAAARLRRAQEAAIAARPYAKELARMLRSIKSRIAEPQHPLLEVAGDPAELVAAGRAEDQVDLAAELLVPLGECHAMAALGENGRRLHPGRPPADDEPAGGRIRSDQCPRPETALTAGAGIDRACDRQALEDATDAALVAADAMDELLLAPVAHLVRELGVGDLRARHRDHVRLARREDLLREPRVLDAADGEHGQ